MKKIICGLAIGLVAACGQEAEEPQEIEETVAVEVQEQEPVWDGNKVVMEAEQLGEGVYALIPDGAAEMAPQGYPIATTSGIVVGDEGVLVIDTMLNLRLATQVQDHVASVTDKPITYIVNTSYHGDHSYGNYAFPEEVIIIQHEVTADYITNHFEADTEFMMQNFGTGRGIEEVIPTIGDQLISNGGEMTLDLGGRTVLIKDFGFAQTGGDLFVWLPEEKILFTGNPIIADPPALPWLLDGHLIETLETLQRVYDFIPDDTRIVPGHGPVTDKATIKWNIDYLTAVRDKVTEAIAEGLTLEETVERVVLTEFQGYALYPWVHPSLNVPAAYRDLSGN